MLDDTKHTFLVLDEAHGIASLAFSARETERNAFERLRRIAATSPRILLLSGTPVLHHEKPIPRYVTSG